MPSVLFVCTANICRSPMAEAILRKKVEREADAYSWRIASAGTWAEDGQVVSENSRLALKARSMDISHHRSQCVSRQLLEQYDLILTMERGHKEALQVEFPELAGRIFLLSEMIGQRFDIADPFGGNLAEYSETANQLDSLITAGYERILSLAR